MKASRNSGNSSDGVVQVACSDRTPGCIQPGIVSDCVKHTLCVGLSRRGHGQWPELFGY